MGFCVLLMTNRISDSYLQHLLCRVRLSVRSSFVYFGTKTTQRARAT